MSSWCLASGNRRHRLNNKQLQPYLLLLACCRAQKLATTDATTLNHIRNIYHMHRRMAETDRRHLKSEIKAECEPHHYKRSNRESLAFSLTSWIPRCVAACCIQSLYNSLLDSHAASLLMRANAHSTTVYCYPSGSSTFSHCHTLGIEAFAVCLLITFACIANTLVNICL